MLEYSLGQEKFTMEQEEECSEFCSFFGKAVSYIMEKRLSIVNKGSIGTFTNEQVELRKNEEDKRW